MCVQFKYKLQYTGTWPLEAILPHCPIYRPLVLFHQLFLVAHLLERRNIQGVLQKCYHNFLVFLKMPNLELPKSVTVCMPHRHNSLPCVWVACYEKNDSLLAGRSGDRNPAAERCPATVQTGAGAHPASYTRRTVFIPAVKAAGASVEVKERVELYLYSPFGLSWPVLWWP